ncbi:MAG TPA: redoxin domain-containing protein [Myxococcota bacterium]|nr:redoxin domain-containing protein [Myxococcota bacterium]
MRLAIALLLLFLICACQSAHMVKPSLLGSPINKDIKFTSTDNKTISLPDLGAGKMGTVLIFWQRLCPCVKRYQNRINLLFDRYNDKLAFFHVSSNANENFHEVMHEYKHRQVPLPLIRDEGAQLKKALDVRGTPSASLLNNKGEIMFLGWIDNERDVNERGRKAYLEDAIAQFLKGEPISVRSSPMFGCAIR